MLIWIVAMVILFYLYWKKGRLEGIGKDVRAIEQKVTAATGKIFCPKCGKQMDMAKPCESCGYDLKNPPTTGQTEAPMITAATSPTSEIDLGHGFKIRGHGGFIDNLQEALLSPSLASLKNNGNGTKEHAIPQTTMKDPSPPTPSVTIKKDEPTLDQLVDQRIATLPSMDTGKLIALKTELDTQVETYQSAVSELNMELGPYRRLQKATTRNLITNLVKDGAIDLNANPELKSLINAPPEGSQIIDTSKALPSDHPVLTPQPALAATAPPKPQPPPEPEPAKSEPNGPEPTNPEDMGHTDPNPEQQHESIQKEPAIESPSGEPTELGNTTPITNVKKTAKAGRSRKRKRQEQVPPEEPKDTEPKDEPPTHETALSSGSSQQLVVQTYLNEQPTKEETQSEESEEAESASEHGEEFADTGFFVSQHSDPEEGNTEEDTDEESSNGNSEDEDGS